MNSRNRQRVTSLLYQKFGGIYCFIGGETLTLAEAVIDHWDNDNGNNRLENLSFLCKSMNGVKNPRGRKHPSTMLSPVCGNAFQQMLVTEGLKVNSVEIIKNRQAEPDFRHWLFWKVRHDGKISFEAALDGGAVFAKCSQETIRRYVKKELSEERPYQLAVDPMSGERIVVLKPEWAAFKAKEEDDLELQKVVANWTEELKEDVVKPPRKKRIQSPEIVLDSEGLKKK